MMNIAEEINELIELIHSVREDIELDENLLFSEDELDSFEILQIIMLINERYDIEIPPYEIKPENFKGVSNILNMIKRVKNES